MAQLKPIKDQVVCITGASSGIGRCTALLFAAKGAKVCAIARNESGLKSLVDHIKLKGGHAVYAVADVANFAELKAGADLCVQAFGRIDTWVGNAGIFLLALAEQTTPEEYRRIMDVNYLGQVNSALIALPHVRAAGGGALIFVSSNASVINVPYMTAYCATKSALAAFIDGLRMELEMKGQTNIAVTNVRPCTINTPLFNKSLSKIGVKPHGPAPVYAPSVVAETIVHCAESQERDVAAGTASQIGMLVKQLMPVMTDKMVQSDLLVNQLKTDDPKSQDDTNFWKPLPHDKYEKVEGDFVNEQSDFSILDWMRTKLSVAAK